MKRWNAKIVRIDQPDAGLLSISLRSGGTTRALIAVTLSGAVEIALVDERPRGAKATEYVTQLRRHLEGATVVEVEQSRRAARFTVTRGGRRRFLVCAAGRPNGAHWLQEADGSVVLRSPGAPRDAPDEEGHWKTSDPTSLRERGAQALRAHRDAKKHRLERALRRRIKRLEKKRDAIAQDLERASKADELAERASLLLAHASQIQPGATHVDLRSWDDPTQVFRIELDPQKSPTQLAQTLFARSKRLKRGLAVAPQRLAAVQGELATLRSLSERFTEASLSELEDVLSTYGVSVVEPRQRDPKRRRPDERSPYRTFLTEDGSTVLVGRGAADNDRLTLRTARPHDHWLHARGASGAHVVVPLDKGKVCSPETLVDAATLAAHFSELRGEPLVDVLHTPRRFVRKRKGSPAGTVTLEREKTIAVRIEAQRLQRLLKSERKST